MADKIIHCWADEESRYEIGSEEWTEIKARGGGTCMLLQGHTGAHEYTPDDKITVTFN